MLKQYFIKDLKEHIGEEIKQPFLLKAVFYNENRFNNKWQDLLIVDVSGNAQIKAWAENMNNNFDQYIDNVVMVTGIVELYKSIPGIVVSNIEPCEGYELSDYVAMMKKNCVDSLKEKLNGYINMISEGPYKNVVQKVLNNTIVYEMSKLPAGTVSHNYCGALLIHTLEVVEGSMALINMYEGLSESRPYPFCVNKDLVITAALLHDVGKFRSFTNFPDMKKTIRGFKVPSHTETISIIDAYNSKLNKADQISNMSDLRHVILATGKDNEAMTMEAIIVSNANRASKEIDSYNTTFLQYDASHPGNSTMMTYSNGLGYRVIRERKE